MGEYYRVYGLAFWPMPSPHYFNLPTPLISNIFMWYTRALTFRDYLTLGGWGTCLLGEGEGNARVANIMSSFPFAHVFPV